MKKRILGLLLSIIITSMCVGCGSDNTSSDTSVSAGSTSENISELNENEDSAEPIEDIDVPSASANSTEDDDSEDVINNSVSTDAVSDNANSSETSDATEDAETTEEPVAEPTEVPEESVTEPTPVPEPQAIYTYTDLSATMYATQTVNVRNLPNTDGEKVGSLATNQEVIVTGQCNETGWYKFELDGQIAFVSNSYLSTEMVEVQESTNSNSENNNAPAGVPNPYEYSEYTWHDMGGWMFMICDKEYGNSEQNHLPAVNILRERYPGAYIYYMCGQQLNDGSGRWLYLASADGTDPTTRLAMTSTYCK